MNDDNAAMEMHLAAIYRTDDVGDLISLNKLLGHTHPVPLFHLARTANRRIVKFRQDAPLILREELLTHLMLETLPGSSLPSFHDTYRRLCTDTPLQSVVWTGPAYAMPEGHKTVDELADDEKLTLVTQANAYVLRRFLPEWEQDIGINEPIAAYCVDGNAVAVCASVRITDLAHEAGVETHPDFRGLGYATKTVAHWVCSLLAKDVTPLYSTSWDNHASQSLATRLGFQYIGSDYHIGSISD